MSTFKVKITRIETTVREVEVEADDAEAAKKIAEGNDMKGEYDDMFDNLRPDDITTEYEVTDHENYWYDWQSLTAADQRAVSRDSMRRGWGYTMDDLMTEFAKFKRAIQKGDRHATSMICARLEDCNYHTICGKLANGDLAGAKDAAEEMYAE